MQMSIITSFLFDDLSFCLSFQSESVCVFLNFGAKREADQLFVLSSSQSSGFCNIPALSEL